nr:hypothetical protein CFP56_65873 [Quercus suber]
MLLSASIFRRRIGLHRPLRNGGHHHRNYSLNRRAHPPTLPAFSPFGQSPGQPARYGRRHSSSSNATTITTPLASETVTVPCRSNGSITLSIHHPLTASAAAATTSPAVLIYLPRGPYLHDAAHDAANVSILQSCLSHHVVQVHYRSGREARYPTPIHDVLTGFDWVVEHLLPKRAIARATRSAHVGRVAVCGELIGGGLATMLALTECRRGQVGVVCAGLNAPVTDWVDLDDLLDMESSSSSQRHRGKATKRAQLDTRPVQDLLQLREQLFLKPEHFFDPFASPLLFFRSTGKAVPPPFPEKKHPTDEFGILAMLNEQDFYRQQHALSRVVHDSSAPNTPPSPQSADSDVPRRASRRFPGKSSGLELPAFHVSAGEDLPFKEQGAELIYRLRQSFTRQHKSSSGSKVLTDEEEAEEEGRDELNATESNSQSQAQLDRKLEAMAKFTLNKGRALWDDSPQGRAHMIQMANWLKEQLR